MPMPGMASGTLGYAGADKSGPTIRNKVPTVLAYLLLDVMTFNFVKGWGAAAAFYGAGSFERHKDAPDGVTAVLWFITEKAVVPAVVLAVADLGIWLNKMRQAHGIGQ
jgi:hypothetical protein